jgi:large subunit ribosomal protein L10Ae
MSKLSREMLRQHIDEVRVESKRAKRRFLQTIELQACLKNYDISKDKRFQGTLRLPVAPKRKFKVCVLADVAHADLAQKAGVACMDAEALKALKKDNKLVKKLAKSYDAFLCSEGLIKQIPRLVGPGLQKAGKFPTPLGNNDDITEKAHDLQCSIKFQLKKVLCLGVAVGNLKMTPEELEKNIILAVNFLVSLLKKNWQNVKSLTIKSSMGKPHRIY